MNETTTTIGKDRNANTDNKINRSRKVKSTPVHLRLYLQGRELQDHKDRSHQKLSRTIPTTKHHSRRSSYQKSNLAKKKFIRAKNFKPQYQRTLNGNSEQPSPSSQQTTLKQQQQPLIHDITTQQSSKDLAAQNNNPEVELDEKVSTNDNTNTIMEDTNTSDDVAGLLEQLKILKESMGISEDEIKWKVVSSKGNGYEESSRRLEKAEADYDRYLYEESAFTQHCSEKKLSFVISTLRNILKQVSEKERIKADVLKQQLESKKLEKQYLDAAAKLESMRTKHAVSNARIEMVQKYKDEYEASKNGNIDSEALIAKCEKNYTRALNSLSKDVEMLNNFSQSCKSNDLPTIFSLTTEAINAVQHITTASKLEQNSCEKALRATEDLFSKVQTESKRKKFLTQKALSDIETWKKRREGAKEYPAAMLQLEKDWRSANEAQNEACLRKMRRLIPTNIKALTIESLITNASDKGVIYTYELASYLKQNRFLHWLVMHPSDIVSDNFLAGDATQFFTNFEQYDINELRALFHIIPESFAFDADGRKGEWRKAFVSHVKTLVKQQNGESVLAGWDALNQKRASVRLKPLDDRQKLNKVYRYQTQEEVDAQVLKFENFKERLQAKRNRLASITDTELPAAKEEYDAVLADARCNNMKKAVGKEQLTILRNEAKNLYQSLTKERDRLKGEIKIAENAAEKSCPNYQQYQQQVKLVAEKLLDFDESIKDEEKLVIAGPFPEAPEIEPRQKGTVFKKLSAREEAAERKKEISDAISKRPQIQIPTNDEGFPNAGDGESKEEEETATTTTPARQVIISPQIRKFLENDFCSPKKKNFGFFPKSPPAVSREKSSSSPVVLQESPEKPILPPTPKSKTLQKFLQRANSISTGLVASSDVGNMVRRPSFLAELQKRGAPNNNSQDADEADTTSSAPKRPSFLAELQSRSLNNKSSAEVQKKTSDALNPKRPSFLDELRSRSMTTITPSKDNLAKVQNNNQDEEDNKTVPPAPSGLSFLAELQLQARNRSGNNRAG